MSISISSRGLAKSLTATAAALVLFGGMASSASAGSIIFKDNFNRGHYGYSSTVGNGWSETQRSYDDVAIRHNHIQLRDARYNYTYNYQTHSYNSSPIDAAVRLVPRSSPKEGVYWNS